MGQRELHRWHILEMAEVAKITLKEAVSTMGVSYRQAKRIRRAVKNRGVKGLIHGNAGRAPTNRITDSVRQLVLDLSGQLYGGFNDTYFTEELLSRETVRQIPCKAGIPPKRRRRPQRHHKRRERMAQEGLMVLWDGSVHQWFGAEHPPCCLISAIDDATGTVLSARFFFFEGALGYLCSLSKIVEDYGIPLTMYQGRHGALHRNDNHCSLDEQLSGRQSPTQVGLALEALSIRPIFALSPPANLRKPGVMCLKTSISIESSASITQPQSPTITPCASQASPSISPQAPTADPTPKQKSKCDKCSPAPGASTTTISSSPNIPLPPSMNP